jgi:hypothetical protein
VFCLPYEYYITTYKNKSQQQIENIFVRLSHTHKYACLRIKGYNLFIFVHIAQMSINQFESARLQAVAPKK